MRSPGRLGLATGPETSRIQALLEEARGGASCAPGGAASGRGVAGPEATVTIPVGDDAAAFQPPPGAQAVLSSDASVEGIHFRREWLTWEAVGYRAAAGALSDLAAMAASPVGLLISVALPPELGEETAASLGRGVGCALEVTGGAVLGGDLVASPGPVFLDITVVGHADVPIRREDARPGDAVWVTGALGGAAAAVHDLMQRLEPHPETRRAFERPQPRIAEGRWLAERGLLRAAIDLSDGLMRDARHLAAASGVGITLEADCVPTLPVLDAIRDTAPGRRFLFSGGEDYELLFTAEHGAVEAEVAPFEAEFGIRLTCIGTVHEGAGLQVPGVDSGDALDGFDHFGTASP